MVTNAIYQNQIITQKTIEGLIREIRRNWFRIMVSKLVPLKVWDYDMKWVIETMSITHTSAEYSDDSILITKVTGETMDISEYLDFLFYDQV